MLSKEFRDKYLAGILSNNHDLSDKAADTQRQKRWVHANALNNRTCCGTSELTVLNSHQDVDNGVLSALASNHRCIIFWDYLAFERESIHNRLREIGFTQFTKYENLNSGNTVVGFVLEV